MFVRDVKPWVQFWALLGMMLACFVIMSVPQVFTVVLGVDMDVDGLRWMQLLSSLIGFACPAWLWAFLFHDASSRPLGGRFGWRYWGLALGGVACWVLLMPFSSILTEWNAGWHLPAALGAMEEALRNITKAGEEMLEDFCMQSGLANLLFNLLVLAVAPAVCEELFFRGALQSTLGRALRNPHWAILVTAILFSALHGDIFGFMPRLLMGLVLGYLYLYGGSIVVNMVAHFVNNATVVVFYYLYYKGIVAMSPTDNVILPWWVVVASLVLSVALFVLIFVIKRKSSAEKSVI